MRGENAGQLGAEEANALTNGDATFQHERADLIDDAGTLRDEPLAHPMQRLQVELIATNFIVGRCTASVIASASR